MSNPTRRLLTLLAALVVLFVAPQTVTITLPHGGNAVAQDKARVSKGEKSDDKVADIRKQLSQTKQRPAEEGKYACCIKPPWDFCLLATNMCPCPMNAGTEKGVCGECYGGWQAGYGALDYTDPKIFKPAVGNLAD